MKRSPLSVLSAEAHAAAAAHHLIRNGIELLSVDNDRPAVVGRSTVVVKAGVAGHVDGAAVDDQIPVGVDAVRVSGAHHDSDIPAVDLNRRAVGGGFLSGVDPVVRALDTDRAAVELDIGGFKPFSAADLKITVVDLKDGFRVNGVILDRDIKLTARDIDKALFGVFAVFGVLCFVLNIL